jgi:hypothetical protein
MSYDVPRGALAPSGVALGDTPAEIDIYAIDEPATNYPRLQIDYFPDMRDASGNRINSYARHVDCGDGRDLDTHELVPPQAQVHACFEAMQRTGGYRFSFSPRQGEPPLLVTAGHWPLRDKVEAVRAVWRRESERARLGQCRFMPPPPPP